MAVIGHPPGLSRADLLAILRDARDRVLRGLGQQQDTCEWRPCVSCAIGRAVMATFPKLDRDTAYPLAEAIRAWIAPLGACIVADRHASIDDMDDLLMAGIRAAEAMGATRPATGDDNG